MSITSSVVSTQQQPQETGALDFDQLATQHGLEVSYRYACPVTDSEQLYNIDREMQRGQLVTLRGAGGPVTMERRRVLFGDRLDPTARWRESGVVFNFNPAFLHKRNRGVQVQLRDWTCEHCGCREDRSFDALPEGPRIPRRHAPGECPGRVRHGEAGQEWRCPHCGEWLPIDEEHWKPAARYENGLDKSRCRGCYNARRRQQYRARKSESNVPSSTLSSLGNSPESKERVRALRSTLESTRWQWLAAFPRTQAMLRALHTSVNEYHEAQAQVPEDEWEEAQWLFKLVKENLATPAQQERFLQLEQASFARYYSRGEDSFDDLSVGGQAAFWDRVRERTGRRDLGAELEQKQRRGDGYDAEHVRQIHQSIARKVA